MDTGFHSEMKSNARQEQEDPVTLLVGAIRTGDYFLSTNEFGITVSLLKILPHQFW